MAMFVPSSRTPTVYPAGRSGYQGGTNVYFVYDYSVDKPEEVDNRNPLQRKLRNHSLDWFDGAPPQRGVPEQAGTQLAGRSGFGSRPLAGIVVRAPLSD